MMTSNNFQIILNTISTNIIPRPPSLQCWICTRTLYIVKHRVKRPQLTVFQDESTVHQKLNLIPTDPLVSCFSYYPWKFNSSPLRIYHPKRKGSSSTILFQGRTVQLREHIYIYTVYNLRIQICPKKGISPIFLF